MKSLRDSTVEDITKWAMANVFYAIEYFEDGCLCIHGGKLPVVMSYNSSQLLHHYLTGCVCSRHPEGELK